MYIINPNEVRNIIGVWYPPEHTFLRATERWGDGDVLGICIVSTGQGYTASPLRYVPVEYYVRALFQVSAVMIGLFVKGLETNNESPLLTFSELQLWMRRHRVYTHWIERLKFTAMCLVGEPFDIRVAMDTFKPRENLSFCIVKISGAISGIAQYVVDKRFGPDKIYYMPDKIRARHPELFN